MTILMLNYEFPPLGGGAGKITQYQSLELSRKHKIIVVTTAFKDLPYHEKIDNIDIYRLPSLRKSIHRSNVVEMLSWLHHARKFCFEFLKFTRIDLIVAHFTLPCGELAYRIHKKLGIPYIVHSHGHDIPWFFPKQMWLYHVLTYFRIQRICRNASKTILLTPQLKKIADKFTGKRHSDKNIVIPNGIDVHAFPYNNTMQFDVFRIFFAGRLVEQKNPLLIIEALKLLDKNDIPFEACIAGDGPLFGMAKKRTEKYGLQNKIRLCGWKDTSFIRNEISRSNVFVLPSKAEAMSVAVLEALCSGLFVITTQQGDQHQLIQPGINGNILSTDSATELAALIIDYYNLFFLQKKGVDNGSSSIIREKYNYTNIGKQYLALVNEIQ